MVNFTCNATLSDLRIRAEDPVVGSLNFHQLGLIVGAACTLISCLLSFFLIFMHATHYTKPNEQRHIIRILFMIPVYAVASLLAFQFYYHAIYFTIIQDCYEAFAIASFFALLCNYVAPTLHEQKVYFRNIQPGGWLWPNLNWRTCFCGAASPWKAPRSGLTWFNIIWTGIYQYCFIRVAMTVTAVLTQYFGHYCESSLAPWFAHVWIEVVESAAVTVAMYCVIQFYIQLRHNLASYNIFLKVVAIKLVIFLSFWQTIVLDALTSYVIKPTTQLAYPDLAVGIPSLLLIIEMAIFSVIHIFAYPYKGYRVGESSKYVSSPTDSTGPGMEMSGKNQGGFLGMRAMVDAMNPIDLVRAFGRSMRWLFVGRKHRENDISYKQNSNDLTMDPSDTSYKCGNASADLPIADKFQRSKFGMPIELDEGAGLVAHAQPDPLTYSEHSPSNSNSGRYAPARQRYDPNGNHIGDVAEDGRPYMRRAGTEEDIGMAMTGEPKPQHSAAAHNMLWGNQSQGGRQQQEYLPHEGASQATYAQYPNEPALQHQYRNPREDWGQRTNNPPMRPSNQRMTC